MFNWLFKKNQSTQENARTAAANQRLTGLQRGGSVSEGGQGIDRPVSQTAFALSRAKRGFLTKRADFYEDLAEALEDRAVLVTELKKYMTRANQRRSVVASLFALWLRRMDTLTFAAALKGTVPPMDSLILLSADTSGKLPQGLRFLSSTVRSVGQIKATLIGAIAVPLVIVAMLIGMLFGFGKFMVPILSAILPVPHWPAMGRMMYSLSMSFSQYGVYWLAFFIGSTLLFRWALPNWVGPSRKAADNYLPFSLYRDYNSAVMLVSLSGLMQSGSSLVGSLRAMRGASAPWMRWHINQVLVNLDRQSAAPAEAFNTGVLERDLYDRVVDYGMRSSFQEALTKIGNQTLVKIEKAVQKKAKIINYLLLAVSGTLLALMIGSVMLTAQQARLELTTQNMSSR